jgi:serine/threonine protein kinase
MDTNQSSTWQNKMLGRYRLTQLLGRGGMGEVWLAEDTQLRRQVAVKLLPSVFATDHDFLQDFEREAQAAAALEHPHILPIHDFGEQIAEDEVATYLITPYISGGTLRDRILIVSGPLPTDEALSYLRQAAEAIDFAHSQHMLHRDIKPANMLLQQGWLFLADFGIAKLLTSTTNRSRTYAGAGTPEYMAPEQAQGKAEPASDRYSFAMVAYHVFTGFVPFRGDTPYSTLIKQMTEEPTPPRQYNPALPQAVEQAILQGLAKRPEDRPASCMALVHSLERGWQMSISAQVDPEATMLAPWNQARQVKPLSLPPTTTPAGLSPMQPVSMSQIPTTNASQEMAKPSTDRPAEPQVPASERPQRKMTRRALLISGTAVLAVGGTLAIYALLRSSSSPTRISTSSQPPPKPLPPGPKNLQIGVPLLSLTGHIKGVSVAKWDPTGRYLATGGEDSYVMLWDLASYLQKGSTSLQSISTPIHRWKLSSPILANGLCWSADGHSIAVVTGESKILVYNAFSNADTPLIYHDAGTANTSNALVHTAIAWSPTANTFATPGYLLQQTQQRVALWQINQTSGPIRTLNLDATGSVRTLIIDEVHPQNSGVNVDMIGWSADGTLVAGHTNFGSVTIWQAATGTVKEVLSLPKRPTTENPTYVLDECVAWSPLNPHLLATSDIDVATLWDVEQNKPLLTLKTSDPVPAITGLTWSPNGKYLAGSYEQSPRVYIWDVQKAESGRTPGEAQPQKLFFPQPGTHVHTATVTDVAWSPDGRYIASASGDTTIVVWQVDAA